MTECGNNGVGSRDRISTGIEKGSWKEADVGGWGKRKKRRAGPT